MLVFFVATAMAMERQITWYLAVDQFGYLNFARDLLSGHVFHDWPPLHGFQQFMPPRTDVLAQTYVDDGGRLYCRYSPGFPMLLAAWMAVFGTYGAHYLNPTLYLVLLAIALVFQLRLFRSPWRAGAGTVLITLFPTFTYLWGLTLTRDMSAHVFAFTGLFLLLPARGRALTAGRMLGAMARARVRRQHPARRGALPRARDAHAGGAPGARAQPSHGAHAALRSRAGTDRRRTAGPRSSACRRSWPTTGSRRGTR